MTFLALLSLALKRLRSQLGLTLLLILSFALTIGILVCVPVFTDAMVKDIIGEELVIKTQTQNSPTFPVRITAMPPYGEQLTLDQIDYLEGWLRDLITRGIGLPLRSHYVQVDGPTFYMRPIEGDERYQDRILAPLQTSLVQSFESHVEIVAGEPFGAASKPEYLNVWLYQDFADELAVQPNDLFLMADPLPKGADPITFRIAGIWKAKDAEDRVFWPDRPSRLFEGKAVTTEEQYRQFIIPAKPQETELGMWYFVLDDTQMSLSNAEHYIAALRDIIRQLKERLPSGRMDLSPLAEIEKGIVRKQALSAILFGFSLPLLGVLIYFISAVSTMLARFRQRELSMLASRGSSKSQILSTILVETIVIALFACPLGIGMGMLLARLLGYTQGFLAFAPRAAAQVHPSSINWLLVALGLFASILARMVPSWQATRVSVVQHEQRAARNKALVTGTRLLFMAFALLATYYAYRQLQRVGTLSLIGIESTEENFDPLLLLAPSLFILIMPMLASELFVVLVRPLGLLARSVPSVSGFLGLHGLGREGGQYRTPIYMLVLCLSLGIFYASIATSADSWLMDRRQYEYGADLTFVPQDLSDSAALITTDSGPMMAQSLPISDYEQLQGASEATRVGNYRATIVSSARVAPIRLMAIDRTNFADVAYFRRDFAQETLGSLLNALALQPDGILLPEQLAESLEVSAGDNLQIKIDVTSSASESFTFQVAGTFEYFPTMYESTAWVAVTNLDYLLLETGGLIEYGVWMRTEQDADGAAILADIRHLGVVPGQAKDLQAKIAQDLRRLERVGMFGMLTVCFLAGAVLSGLGLLVYNVASVLGRSLRFAVWRALGIKRIEVLSAVSIEYLTTLLYGLVAGIALGISASYLYVPFFRLTEQAEIPIPPFVPIIDWPRALQMSAALGIVFVVLEVGMLFQISRSRIFEVLRLGIRE